MSGIARMPQRPEPYTVHDTPFRNQSFGIGEFLSNGVHLAIRGASLAMPYEQRIRFARSIGWGIIRFHRGYRHRIEDNLRRVFPDMAAAERLALHQACARNIGQSLMEHMHMNAFADRIGSLDILGEGVTALSPDRGALIVSGHFGQFEGVRVAYRHVTGRDCGFFFRPHNNGFYDRHWQSYLLQAGAPLVPKGGPGRQILTRLLAEQGAVLMVIDQAINRAPRLDFMGHPAKTALTAAELALKYDVPLIPAYAIRRDVLTDYKVVFEAPIPPGDPKEMTEALNASLTTRVRANPEQYLWTHRRWR